jgi:hypothetical protein
VIRNLVDFTGYRHQSVDFSLTAADRAEQAVPKRP